MAAMVRKENIGSYPECENDDTNNDADTRPGRWPYFRGYEQEHDAHHEDSSRVLPPAVKDPVAAEFEKEYEHRKRGDERERRVIS